MDEMQITTKFTTKLLSHVIKVLIKRNTDCDIDLNINSLKVTVGEKVNISMDAETSMSKEDFKNLILKNL